LELRFREKGEAIGGVVVHGVGTVGHAKRLEFLRVELVKIGHSSRRTRRLRGGRFPGSGIGKAAGSVRSRRNRRDRKSLGKGEPEIEGEGWNGKSGVDGRWIHSRAEGKIGDTRRAGRSVSSDGASDGGALVIAKTKGDKIIDKKEGGANRSAAAGSLKSSVVGTTWNMPKGSN
jgi:hypothetical protein